MDDASQQQIRAGASGKKPRPQPGLIRRKYRRAARNIYRYLRHPRRRRKNALIRWLGDRLCDRELWVPTRRSVAGGLGLGVFVSMMPPFPPQMPVAATIATIRRRNIPIAVGACWISNPFTWIPILYFQGKLGAALLNFFGAPPIEFHWRNFEKLISSGVGFGEAAVSIGIGVIVSSIVFGLLSFFLVHAIYEFLAFVRSPARRAKSGLEE